METEKYISLWKKYLPVIRIQLKKSLEKSETLGFNKSEFIATGNRDLSGYTFNIIFEGNKVINDISGSAVARDLCKVLIEDATIKEFMKNKQIKLSMGRDFVLKLNTISK